MEIKKKIENIWFYYKIPIIIGVCVIGLIINVVISKMNEVKYDHSVAIISAENYPSEENVEKLRNIFEEKYNGTVDVVIYNIALGELNQDEVLIAKLDLDLGHKTSKFLFIEDMDTFKKTTADIEFSEVALVKDIPELQGLGLDNFYYCIRK